MLSDFPAWQVGTDANAQLLKDSLQKCGVDLSYLREVEGPSGTAMIMVDPSGDLCWLHAYCYMLAFCILILHTNK